MEDESSVSVTRTPRQRFWLEHLNACREQQLSLKAYAREHGLSVSALYTAKSALKRGASASRPETSTGKSTFVPVRVAPAAAMVRVLLPNGVVVEVPESIEPRRLQPLLASASTLS